MSAEEALAPIRARRRDEGCPAHDDCLRADIARLLAAVDAVTALATYWETLADGDKHYAARIRTALTTALGDGA